MSLWLFLRRLYISFETRCIITTLVALFLNESEQAKHGLTIIAEFSSISLALTLSASAPLPLRFRPWTRITNVTSLLPFL